MIYIFLSILLFAANNVLWKKNLEHSPVLFLMGYRAFFTSAGAFLLLFCLYDLTTFPLHLLFRITLGSLFGVIGLFTMLSVVKNASLQWVGIYNLLGISFTTLYLWLFEAVDFSHSILGLIIVLVGFLLFIYANASTYKITTQQHFMLLLMTFSFNCSSVIHWKNLTANIPPLLIITNQELVVFSTALIGLLWSKKWTEIKTQVPYYFLKVFLMSFVVFLALLCSFLGLKITNPIVSSVLFLATPLATILFSAFFFKEKITLKNALAILMVSLGAFILHYFAA